MTIPRLIVPVEKEELILPAHKAGADIIYADYTNFIQYGHFKKGLMTDFMDICHGLGSPFYLYFTENILESHLKMVHNLIGYVYESTIDGIMVNDFSVLDIIKKKEPANLPCKLHIDSGLHIHNIQGCKIFKPWNPDIITITEELYLKNVIQIKNQANENICINISEGIWFFEQALNWGVELFKIEGNYETPEKLTRLICLIKSLINDINEKKGADNLKIEEAIDLIDHSKPQKLYRTDHFTRKFKDFSGNNFEFKGNIKFFHWDIKKVRHPLAKLNPAKINKKSTKLRLRMTSLEQIEALESYIQNTNNNFVDIIEYGDIINTKNLSKQPYNDIINRVKLICKNHNLSFYLTTPKILIERDFDSVSDNIRNLCTEEPVPEGIVINNTGLWKFVNETDKVKDLHIETGYGIEIYNSGTVRFFENPGKVSGISLSNMLEYDYIKKMTESLGDIRKSMVVLGPSKLDTSGLCPLNANLAVVSRLSCKAPCQKHNYAVVDPSTSEMIPVVLDGFCRFHLVNSFIEDMLPEKDKYINAGITDFVIDFTALPAKMVAPLLDRYVLAFSDPEKYIPLKMNVTKYKPGHTSKNN